MATTYGQTVYQMFPDFAQPGQLFDLAYNEIVSFPAAEVIQPGRVVCLNSDGLSCQQAQGTSTTLAKVLGISVLNTAREGTGAVGITGYGIGGAAYQIGEMVPVLMRGRIYAEWDPTGTQSGWGAYTINESSTTATKRGTFTNAAAGTTTGSEVANTITGLRGRQALSSTGTLVVVDVNLPGSNG